MADVLDVLTVAEALRAVDKDATDTAGTLLLAQMTTAVSRGLDHSIGPVVRRIVTDELQEGDGSGLQLALSPVASVTTVTEHAGGTATVLTRETPTTTPDGYVAEPYGPEPGLLSGRLVRRSGGSDSAWACGRRNVKVTYVAGRAVDTATVDARFKHAAGVWLQYLWRTREPSVATVGEFDVPAQAWPKFGCPHAVRDLLVDVWQLATPTPTTTTFVA